MKIDQLNNPDNSLLSTTSSNGKTADSNPLRETTSSAINKYATTLSLIGYGLTLSSNDLSQSQYSGLQTARNMKEPSAPPAETTRNMKESSAPPAETTRNMKEPSAPPEEPAQKLSVPSPNQNPGATSTAPSAPPAANGQKNQQGVQQNFSASPPSINPTGSLAASPPFLNQPGAANAVQSPLPNADRSVLFSQTSFSAVLISFSITSENDPVHAGSTPKESTGAGQSSAENKSELFSAPPNANGSPGSSSPSASIASLSMIRESNSSLLPNHEDSKEPSKNSALFEPKSETESNRPTVSEHGVLGEPTASSQSKNSGLSNSFFDLPDGSRSQLAAFAAETPMSGQSTVRMEPFQGFGSLTNADHGLQNNLLSEPQQQEAMQNNRSLDAMKQNIPNALSDSKGAPLAASQEDRTSFNLSSSSPSNVSQSPASQGTASLNTLTPPGSSFNPSHPSVNGNTANLPPSSSPNGVIAQPGSSAGSSESQISAKTSPSLSAHSNPTNVIAPYSSSVPVSSSSLPTPPYRHIDQVDPLHGIGEEEEDEDDEEEEEEDEDEDLD